MEPVSTTIIAYVSLKLIDQFIATEGYRRIKRIFFPKNKYVKRLKYVIENTIIAHEKEYPYDSTGAKFPFYHSEILFTELSKYVLFDTQYSIEDIRNKLKENLNIITPGTVELGSFFKIFVKKINEDETLKKLFIDENYKQRIFDIDESIKDLKRLLSTRISQVDAGIINDFYRQLDEAENYLSEFKPQTALTELNNIEKAIDESLIEQSRKDYLFAKCYHLKSYALHDLGNSDDSYEYNIKAHGLNPAQLEYKAKAATTNFFLERYTESFELSLSILKLEPTNPRAWAVKAVREKTNFIDIPITVKKNVVFVSIFYSCYSKLNLQNGQDELLNAFVEEGQSPERVTYQNISFWFSVATICLDRVLNEHPNSSMSEKNRAYEANYKLEYAFNILSLIKEETKGTEFANHCIKYGNIIWVYSYVSYLLNDEKNAVDDMHNTYLQIKSKFPSHLFTTIVCLSQIGEHRRVIELIDEDTLEKYPFLQWLLGVSYLHLDNLEKAIPHIERYFGNLERVTETDFINLLSIIDSIQKHEESAQAFYDQYLKKKLFEYERHEKILKLEVYKHDLANKDYIQKEAKGLVTNFDTYGYVEKLAIANIYSSIGELEDAIALIERFINVDEESIEYRLLIEMYNLTKNNSTRLLELLSHWRRTHTPYGKFLFYEIELLKHIPDHNEILEVAGFGAEHFPEQIGFLYFRIKYNHLEDNEAELEQLLTDNILSYSFHWEPAFDIAKICLQRNQQDLGYEILYTYTVNNYDNSVVKENYFTILGAFKKEPVRYERVEVGYYVVLNINNNQKVYEVTEGAIKNNRLIEAIYQKQIHEEVAIRETNLSDKTIKIQIIDILDKYSGLWKKIYEEVSQPSTVTNNVKMIEMGKTVEEMSDKLVKEFGPDEERKRIIIDDALKKYHNRQITLFDLFTNFPTDNPLILYEYLTSKFSDGFYLIPNSIYQNVNLVDETRKYEYVLDIYSVLLFWDIGISKENANVDTFIISHYVREYVKREITLAKSLEDAKMSLRITPTGVMPIPYPPSYNTERIKRLESILTWIDANCSIEYNRKKLDLLLELEQKSERYNMYWDYYIDNVFLASEEDRILITDDATSTKNHGGAFQIVSTDKFLFAKLEDYQSNVVYKLVEKNCLGFSITCENLILEFEKVVSIENNASFHRFLMGLPFFINNDDSVLNESIKFVKYLYARSDLSLEYRSKVSTDVFLQAIKGYKINSAFISRVRAHISDELSLLGGLEANALNDFADALETLK
jgi:hypothetical protein